MKKVGKVLVVFLALIIVGSSGYLGYNKYKLLTQPLKPNPMKFEKCNS